MRTCPACNIRKTDEEFYAIRTKRTGLSVYCKPCHQLNVRASKYGISVDEILRMLLEQENRCATCRVEFVHGVKVTTFAVDHDEDTGKVRGLLCNACNRGLGFLKHDPEILEAAIRYLG